MKHVVFVACALGFGILPGIAGLPHESLLTVAAFGILLGLIYFVLHGQDWPPRLVPWLFACVAVGRLAAYWWLKLRHDRQGPLVDTDVWIFGGLAAVCFAYDLWKWIRNRGETSTAVNPRST